MRAPLLPGWVRWAVVVCVAGFIFYTSILTAPPDTVLDAGRPDLVPLDKWRHFLAYATFGGALAYATADWTVERRYAAAFVLGTTIAYGVGIEVGQLLLADRDFSVMDAYANALGAVLISPWYLVRPYVAFEPLVD